VPNNTLTMNLYKSLKRCHYNRLHPLTDSITKPTIYQQPQTSTSHFVSKAPRFY